MDEGADWPCLLTLKVSGLSAAKVRCTVELEGWLEVLQ